MQEVPVDSNNEKSSPPEPETSVEDSPRPTTPIEEDSSPPPKPYSTASSSKLKSQLKGVSKEIEDLKNHQKTLQKRKSGILTLTNKYTSGNLPRVQSLKANELNPLIKKNQTLRGLGDKKTLRSARFEKSLTLRTEQEIQDDVNSEEFKKYPFKGKWESNEVELDTFMSELNLTTKFAKLAVAYGGDVTNELKIKQKGEDGDQFVITENNERRKIKYAVNVGEDFISYNELGEELACSSRWGEDERELIIEETNLATEEKTIIKRKINMEDGTLIESRAVGDKEETTRTYNKKIKSKKI